jgi:AcrR family transcriptional regulator
MARYNDKQKAALDTLMRDDVYDHAMEILANEGMRGLTMERLAHEIGVSRGTLYNYFVDKNAVIDFVEERAFAPVIASIERIATGDGGPEIKLTKIAGWIITAIYEDGALVLALSPLRPESGRYEHKIEKKNRLLRVIEAVIRDGVASGAFKRLSPVVIAEAFVGSIVGMIESMAANGVFYRADAVVPTLMELFLGGLRQRPGDLDRCQQVRRQGNPQVDVKIAEKRRFCTGPARIVREDQ